MDPVSTTPRRLLIIALATLVIAGLGGVLVHRYCRWLWHPILVRIVGGSTVEHRLSEIVQRHPDLAILPADSVRLVGIKDPGHLDVIIDGQFWRRFPWTANSGHAGPKLRAGDGQIPEGVYRIDALNPNSSYHLSLRVSYPNTEDRRRSAASGIDDLGGDIYIHGKEASIGCIAIGDDAIEQVFLVVSRAGLDQVELLIAPCDLRTAAPPPGGPVELYEHLREQLLAWAPPP